MITVRARVHNGRIVVDEPTDLPEGTELALVSEEDELPADVIARLLAAPPTDEPLTKDASEELERAAHSPLVSHADVKRKLAARKRG